MRDNWILLAHVAFIAALIMVIVAWLIAIAVSILHQTALGRRRYMILYAFMGIFAALAVISFGIADNWSHVEIDQAEVLRESAKTTAICLPSSTILFLLVGWIEAKRMRRKGIRRVPDWLRPYATSERIRWRSDEL